MSDQKQNPKVEETAKVAEVSEVEATKKTKKIQCTVNRLTWKKIAHQALEHEMTIDAYLGKKLEELTSKNLI